MKVLSQSEPINKKFERKEKSFYTPCGFGLHRLLLSAEEGCKGVAFEAQEAMNSIFGEFSKTLSRTSFVLVSCSSQQEQFLVSLHLIDLIPPDSNTFSDWKKTQ